MKIKYATASYVLLPDHLIIQGNQQKGEERKEVFLQQSRLVLFLQIMK